MRGIDIFRLFNVAGLAVTLATVPGAVIRGPVEARPDCPSYVPIDVFIVRGVVDTENGRVVITDEGGVPLRCATFEGGQLDVVPERSGGSGGGKPTGKILWRTRNPEGRLFNSGYVHPVSVK